MSLNSWDKKITIWKPKTINYDLNCFSYSMFYEELQKEFEYIQKIHQEGENAEEMQQKLSFSPNNLKLSENKLNKSSMKNQRLPIGEIATL